MFCSQCGAQLNGKDQACPRCGYVDPAYRVVVEVPSQKQTDALAILSLIFGILSVLFCCFRFISFFAGLAAIGLGVVSLVQKKGGADAKGMSITGIVLGAIAVLMTIFMGLMAFSMLGWLTSFA